MAEQQPEVHQQRQQRVSEALRAATPVPEDVLAEQDVEERRAGRVPPVQSHPAEEVPEEILVEQDVEARLAEEAARRPTDEQAVEVGEEDL